MCIRDRWGTGLVAILFVLGYSVYRNALPMLRVTRGRDDEYDRALPIIAVGFLSAYLPWVLVSRLTFIYHYFASVPFIILATAQEMCIRDRCSAARPCIFSFVWPASRPLARRMRRSSAS